ncbi:MAG: hypothetical protein NWF03_02415 [Candidatus Bathyarchaeota archaeon]|nr:hypothetical protein [Candidatus Bathyarchaeota archaeon]
MEETVEIICPNPKCQRKIKEPILLTVLSVSPRKEYEACPYCFVRLDKEITPEDEDTEFETEYEEVEDEEEMESSSTETTTQKSKSAGPSFLDRVKALIPNANGTQKKETAEIDDTEEAEELDEEEEEMTAEEQETEELDDEYEDEENEEDDEEDEEPEEEQDEEYEEDDEEDAVEAETEQEETEAKPEKETKTTADGECPESFGYLANRPKDAPIPSGCLMCPRMVDCMLKVEDD